MFVIVWVPTPEHSAYHPAGAQASWVVLSCCSDGSPTTTLFVTSLQVYPGRLWLWITTEFVPGPLPSQQLRTEWWVHHHGGRLPDARDSR